MKIFIKKCVLFLSTILGRYVPFGNAETNCEQGEAIAFLGDIPLMAGHVRSQRRLSFITERKYTKEVRDVLYSINGMVWIRGNLLRAYSCQEPSIRDILSKPRLSGAIFMPVATIVQAETPITYGDWVSEHLMSIVCAMPLPAPLLLPSSFAARPYVRRDLQNLKIIPVFANMPVHVEKATVLQKIRPGHFITAAEIAIFRKTFLVPDTEPRPGSIVYLSRGGVVGDGFQRSYPSDAVAKSLVRMGVEIIDTSRCSYDDYRAMISRTETVIADFGSAILNLLFWNSKNLIVLFTDDWWDVCALFLAKELDMTPVRYINVDKHDILRTQFELKRHLEELDVLSRY